MTVLSNDGKSELTKLKRLRGLSAENPSIIFNNIGYLIDKKFLIELYYLLDGNKAVGIDKVTKEEFGKDLESNLISNDLLLKFVEGYIYQNPQG